MEVHSRRLQSLEEKVQLGLCLPIVKCECLGPKMVNAVQNREPTTVEDRAMASAAHCNIDSIAVVAQM